jgi:hypothetical protein
MDLDPKLNPFNVTIPHRILPGRLSVLTIIIAVKLVGIESVW